MANEKELRGLVEKWRKGEPMPASICGAGHFHEDNCPQYIWKKVRWDTAGQIATTKCADELAALLAAPGPEGEAQELVVKVLEVAQLRDDTDEGGIVEMPDEEEWGLIVGLARKASRL